MCVFKLWSRTLYVHLLQKAGPPLGFCSACHVFTMPHMRLWPHIWTQEANVKERKESSSWVLFCNTFNQNIQDCGSETPPCPEAYLIFLVILFYFDWVQVLLGLNETRNKCSVQHTGRSVCEAVVLLGAHRGERDQTLSTIAWTERTSMPKITWMLRCSVLAGRSMPSTH